MRPGGPKGAGEPRPDDGGGQHARGSLGHGPREVQYSCAEPAKSSNERLLYQAKAHVLVDKPATHRTRPPRLGSIVRTPTKKSRVFTAHSSVSSSCFLGTWLHRIG